MPKQRPSARGERKADPVRVAAFEQLFDLIARLLARHWVRMHGKEVGTKPKAKTRPGQAE